MVARLIVVVVLSGAVGVIAGWFGARGAYSAWTEGRKLAAVWIAVLWVAAATIAGFIIGSIEWVLS